MPICPLIVQVLYKQRRNAYLFPISLWTHAADSHYLLKKIFNGMKSFSKTASELSKNSTLMQWSFLMYIRVVVKKTQSIRLTDYTLDGLVFILLIIGFDSSIFCNHSLIFWGLIPLLIRIRAISAAVIINIGCPSSMTSL